MPSVAGTKDFSIIIGERFVTLIGAVVEIDAAKVHFSRAYEIQPEEMPCISVEIGPDVPLDPDGQMLSNHTDSEQVIYVDLYDQRNDAQAMVEIAFQRALCHRAILTNHTLGLSFVVQAKYGGAEEPASDEESGLPGWTIRVPFPVHYRFNDDDRTVFTG